MARAHPSGKDEQAAQAAERQSPSSRIVHQAIVQEGTEELRRPAAALFWSAVAAGLSMGFSLVAQSELRARLSDQPWRPLVDSLGYSVGFLVVILGRQQLFTENTLTPILPLIDRDEPIRILEVARLWLAVLVGNLVGVVAIAWVLGRSDLLSPEVRRAAAELGREALAPGFGVVLLRGIMAGWLIALIVWLLPAAETAHVWIIIIITWLIGVGHFSHVIAGSVDVSVLAWSGEVGWLRALGSFTAPALIGNIIGGVTLVAFLNHAQVKTGRR
ncbi:MAG TPA: formate/nitrite transporter family protein [Opitutaceae bacterium]|nr:formate/nitrite transporter family protein [Opitutaceae bacterium]